MKSRGMLLATETVKMVLALISLVLLIYLLYSIYYSNLYEKEFVEAQATMDKIKELVEASVTGEISAIGPKKWIIFSYLGDELKPNQCYGENCICICDEVIDDLVVIKNRQVGECSSDGVCEVVPNLKYFGDIKIEEGGKTDIELIKEGDLWSVVEI